MTTRTTAQPSTLQGSKARFRASHELLEELNPMMLDLRGMAAAIGASSTRALGEDGGEDAQRAMLTLADFLRRDVEKIDQLYTQALASHLGLWPERARTRPMTDEPEVWFSATCRRIDENVVRMDDRLSQLTMRVNDIHAAVAGLRRDQANDAEASAHLHARFDQLVAEVDRIKRRLDITEG